MTRKTQILTAILLFTGISAFPAGTSKPPVVSEATLLHEMTDRDALARLPYPAYTTRQFSSYDRKAVSPDQPGWFGNDDWSMFIRTENRNGRTEHVLMDTDGPGAIVRFWMTFAGTDCGRGTLRIYIDNAAEPVLEASAFEILSGTKVAGEPLAASVSTLMRYDRRGHNLYYPIPYAKHCKVTYESPNVYAGPEPEKRKGTENVYYNIECRTYAAPTKVVSYTGIPDEGLRKAAENARKTLTATKKAANGAPKPGFARLKATLAPDQTAGPTIRGTRAIREITLRLEAQDLPQALRSTVMSIRFDGEQTVWIPVGEFFGIGYKAMHNDTFFTETDEQGTMKAYWVMPFEKECEVSFRNFGTQEVTLEGGIVHTPWKWDRHSLHFGAAWHQYTDVKTGANGKSAPRDIVYTELSGEGRYVGDCLTLYNTVNGWWGEGDEKIYVDGETFPSHFGTGTEDYYGYAWCRPEVFTGHPFIAMPAGDGNLGIGYTVNSRYRMLDAIPFSRSLRFDMELWHWQEARMNYAPATMWYMRPGGVCKIAPDTAGVRRPVVLRRSQLVPPVLTAGIEGEDLEIRGCTGGKAYGQYRTNGLWSQNTQLFWHNAPVGSMLTLGFESAVETAARFEGICSLAKDYGTFRICLNGEELTPAIALYAPELITREVPLGSGHIRKGENTLTIEAIAPATGFTECFFGLDRLVLHLQ